MRACREVAGTQEKLLMRLLDRNGDSEFGQRHRFGAMRCVDDYRTGVPLSTYEDYRKAVERIAQGVPGVLTSEPVVLLEPTSGSTGPSKLIPYTRSLKAEFRRAIAPWIVDMFARHPGLLWGQSYWSVSPVVRRDEYSESGIPIGFEDDSEYLGSFGRMLVRNVLAVPTGVRLLEDMDTFRYVTLLFLLRSRSLSMISIWHPTFLTLLLEPLDEWLDRLTDDIATGRLTPTGAMPAETGRQLRSAMRPDPERASEIENCLASASHVGEASPALWPRLGLVSCWADGNAGPYLPALTALFPHATCQPKGLVSTEGVASIPRHGRRGAALAVRSHFFEFLPQDSSPDGETVLAHELEADRRYSLVMTTGGGLYRYLTGDLVDVVSHIDSCPLFEFAGKDAHISDRFGEKLNSVHVQQALDRAVARYNIAPDFAIVAFEDAPGCPGYTLFIESHDASDQELLTLGAALEESLQENYHYRYCRDLGQLGRLRLFRIETGAQRTYATTCQENGQRIGDLKPPALHTMAGWSQSFSGRFLERGVPPVPGGATA
ncbi:MAG: GH3 auxin-responsive promoter family protein [bacterium]|nr:GH3 auxin-responsive promoter family protein [bacterium]